MKRTFRDKLLVHLDGAAYQLGRRQGKRLDPMVQVEGDKWVLTDFDSAPPHIQTVEAPAKYADLLLFRRLRERGELDAQGKVFVHWKRKKSANSADLFFTAVDGQVLGAYMDTATHDPDHHLLFAVNTLLLTALNRYAEDKVTAILFEHGRHVDILLGRKGQVLQAGRVSTYEDSEEARKSLGDVARGEIQSLVSQANVRLQRIVYFNWLLSQEPADAGPATVTGFAGAQSKTPDSIGATVWRGTTAMADTRMEQRIDIEWVRSMARTLEVDCQVLKIERFPLAENEVLLTSTPSVIRHLQLEQSVSPGRDRLLYRTHRQAPLAVMLTWVIGLLLFAGGMWFQHKNLEVATQIQVLAQSSAESGEDRLPPVDPSYKDTLSFAQELEQQRRLPSFQEIISDLSTARAANLYLDTVRIEYGVEGPLVKLNGRIMGAFDKSSTAHKEFLDALSGMGYTAVKSNFKTDVQHLSFDLELRRSKL